MSAIKIMAAALDQELQDRGVFGIGRADCETIIAAVFKRAAEVANTMPLTARQAEDLSRRNT